MRGLGHELLTIQRQVLVIIVVVIVVIRMQRSACRRRRGRVTTLRTVLGQIRILILLVLGLLDSSSLRSRRRSQLLLEDLLVRLGRVVYISSAQRHESSVNGPSQSV